MIYMSTPSVAEEMMRYFMQLNDEEQKSILHMIRTFLTGRGEAMTLEEYNRELEQADEEIEKGSFSHEEVKKRHLKS